MRIANVASAITLAIVGLVSGKASAQDVRDSLIIVIPDGDPKIVEQFWTKKRRENATPEPLPEVDDQTIKRLLKAKKGNDRQGLEEEFIFEPSDPENEKMRGSTVPADIGKYPYKTGGVLLYTNDGNPRKCTAEFVGDGNVVMTAAHCLYSRDSGKFSKNLLFERAYNNGNYQQETVGTCYSIFPEWITDDDNPWQWDVAFIRTESKSTGGYLGLRAKLSPSTEWEAIGYPINFGASQQMFKVFGNLGLQSQNLVEMEGNPMRKGASGGAWIATQDAKSYAIGVNSFFNSKHYPASMFGPLFRADVGKLFRSVLICN